MEEEDDPNIESESLVEDEGVEEEKSNIDHGHSQLLRDTYNTSIKSFPTVWQTETAVLWSMVFTVSRCGGDDVEHSKTATTTDNVYTPTGHFIKLSTTCAPSTFRSLVNQAHISQNLTNPVILNADDDINREFFLLKSLHTTHVDSHATPRNARSQPDCSLYDLMQFKADALARRQIMRFLAIPNFPVRPSMSAAERGMKESELLTFTDLSPEDLYFHHKLHIFNELVTRNSKPLPNFTGTALEEESVEGVDQRVFVRQVNGVTLSSLFDKEGEAYEAKHLSSYYEMTDEMLHVLLYPPPNRRHARKVWTPSMPDPPITEEKYVMTPAGTMVCSLAHFHSSYGTPKAGVVDGGGKKKKKKGVKNVEAPTSSSPNLTYLNPFFTARYAQHVLGVRLNTYQQTLGDGTSVDPSCHFFFHTGDEGVRYTFLAENQSYHNTHTTYLHALFPSLLSVTLSTRGDVKIASDARGLAEDLHSPHVSYASYPLMYETHRVVGEGGKVMRTFNQTHAHGQLTHPFHKDVMYPNGLRQLFFFADKVKAQAKKQKKDKKKAEDFFEGALAGVWASALEDGEYMLELDVFGGVQCFQKREDELWHPVASPANYTPTSLRSTSRDAVTHTVVHSYKDGRLRWERGVGRAKVRGVTFPDRTTFVHYQQQEEPEDTTEHGSRADQTHSSTLLEDHPDISDAGAQDELGMVYVFRQGFAGFPSVEVDLEVDHVCRRHIQGMEVPINKGGLRVRMRVVMPDGAAVLLKYDTRVTADTKGSLQLVTRSRECALAGDQGHVTFHPSSDWDDEKEKAFQKDCRADADIPALASPSTPAHPSPTHTHHPADTKGVGSASRSLTASSAPTRSLATGASASAGKHAASHRRSSAPGTASKHTSSPPPPPPPPPPRSSFTANPSPAAAAASPSAAAAAMPLPRPLADPSLQVNLLSAEVKIRDREFNTFTCSLALARSLAASAPATAHDTAAPSSPAATSAEVADPPEHAQNHPHPQPPEGQFTITVTLSGEVEGLAPPALPRQPLAPRLFVQSRDGEARELLPAALVSAWVWAGAYDAWGTSVVRGEGTRDRWQGWQVLSQRPVLTSLREGCAFSTVFGPRNYVLSCEDIHILPCALLHAIHTQHNTHYIFDGPSPPPRVFACYAYTQRPPPGPRAQQDILSALSKCEAFRAQRMASIDRFAIEDPRSPSEIEEHEALVKRLKQAYKAAKMQAAKRKEQKKVSMEAAEDEAAANPLHPSSPKKFQPTKLQGAIQEAKEEEEEDEPHAPHTATMDDDDDMDFGNDDEDAPPDPEEMAIRETFDDYSVDPAINHDVHAFANTPMMPLSSLQEALVRLTNTFVSTETIDKAIRESGEVEWSMEEITLHEFRGIFKALQEVLRRDAGGADAWAEGDLDGNESVSSFGSRQSARDYNSRPSSLPTTPIQPTRPSTKPATAPPLNLTALQQSEHGQVAGSHSQEEVDGDVVVGSALNVARKKNQAK